MVHQHFTLADNLSVLDNVMLGTEPLWWPFTRRAPARARLFEVAQRFGLRCRCPTRVWAASRWASASAWRSSRRSTAAHVS